MLFKLLFCFKAIKILLQVILNALWKITPHNKQAVVKDEQKTNKTTKYIKFYY